MFYFGISNGAFYSKKSTADEKFKVFIHVHMKF